MADLFLTPIAPKPTVAHSTTKLVATYDYKDEQGNLLYQVLRFEPKSFKQRHKNGNGEWVWTMEGVRRVLYHLPEVLQAEEVFYVEGEKDADNLIAWGKIATTSSGGANNWKPELAAALKDKKVILIPDNDGAGYKYMQSVGNAAVEAGADVWQILLPGETVKDVSDWIDAGGDAERLLDLAHPYLVTENTENTEELKTLKKLNQLKNTEISVFDAHNAHTLLPPSPPTPPPYPQGPLPSLKNFMKN